MTQRDMIERLTALMAEYPEADVRFLVDNYELCDDTAWTAHGIWKVDYTWWYDCEGTGRIYTDPEEWLDEREDETTPIEAVLKLGTYMIVAYTRATP